MGILDAGTGRLSHQVALPGVEPSAVPCSAALRLGSGMLTTSGSDCHLPPPSDLTLGIPVARSIGPGLSTPELEVVAVATSQDGRYIAYARRGSVASGTATSPSPNASRSPWAWSPPGP